MLAHLQGISPSAGGTPCHFFRIFFAKNACLFFSVSVLLFKLVERFCFSRFRDFFYSLSEIEVGHILYSYFSICKIIVHAILHTLKLIHTWDKGVIKFTVSQPDSDFCHNKHRPTIPNAIFMTTYCCAIATSFTQKITNNKKCWGSWNSATIHSNIRKGPSGYDNATFKQRKTRSYRSKLRGGTYFEQPDHCQKLSSWWNDTNFCHPVCQRILLGVWGITALNL